jgi:hypothetical protein
MTFIDAFPWPLDDEMADGWFNGVPYPLGDMRPQGFLGRNFAHQFAAILQVEDAVNRWSEDDILHVLSVVGWDQPGNYILGEQALRRFLRCSSTAFIFSAMMRLKPTIRSAPCKRSNLARRSPQPLENFPNSRHGVGGNADPCHR